jgi:hypothetical protein
VHYRVCLIKEKEHIFGYINLCHKTVKHSVTNKPMIFPMNLSVTCRKYEDFHRDAKKFEPLSWQRKHDSYIILIFVIPVGLYDS